MADKVWYPVFLDVEGRRAVVVGAGPVALRKTRGLIEAGAKVTVIAPRFHDEFDELAIERIEREFVDADVEDAALVFAATDARDVNRRIGALARARGILANIADARDECAFIVPARVRRGNVQIAISTGGRSPKLAAELRQKLEKWLEVMRP
jgi:siroheme synthase-like protein